MAKIQKEKTECPMESNSPTIRVLTIGSNPLLIDIGRKDDKFTVNTERLEGTMVVVTATTEKPATVFIASPSYTWRIDLP